MTDSRLVVFDFDGTLVDAQAHFDQALIEFTAAEGLSCDIDKMKTNYVDPDRLDLGFGVPFAEQRGVLKRYHDYMDAHRERFLPGFFAGADDMLRDLGRDYTLAIVTMRDRVSTLQALDKYGYGQYFTAYRTSCCARERGYRGKPAPDKLLCVMRDMQKLPEQVVVVGDTTADIDMANAAGVKSIGVLWGAHSRERLSVSNPAAIIDNIADIAHTVRKILSA